MESYKVLSVAGLLLIWLTRNVNCQDSSSASQSNTDCSFLDEYKDEDDFEDVYLRFFWGEDFSEPGTNSSVPFQQFTELVNNENFDNSRCVILVVGGWNSTDNMPKIVNVINGFLYSNNSNVVQLLWSSVTFGKPYEESAALGSYLAPMLAESMDEGMEAGVPCIHMIGHGLGAQLIGATSRVMKTKAERLIALEPSGSLFTRTQNCFQPLSEEDAQCVCAVHTDAGGYGTAYVTGTIDLWANGGYRSQPGCSDVSLTELYTDNEIQDSGCSHHRILDLTAEAIFNKSSILAVSCPSWEMFEDGLCFDNDSVAYFDPCHKDIAPGNYYFKTSGSYPFGEGIAGTRP